MKSGPEYEIFKPESQSKTYEEIVSKRIKTIMKRLKPDEELQIFCGAETDRMRVSKIEFTEGSVVIAHGPNEDAYLVSTVFSLELTCKIVKVAPESARMPIGFISQRK